MSNSKSSAASRVISLNSLGRDRSPGRRILGECRDQLTSSLCLWLHDVAAPISEELFVLADSTRERLQQTRYLDLRADIEKDWSHLVESFRRELSKQTERCQNQENTDESKADGVLNIPDFDGLQLLGDDDLSEHIVLREFAAQLFADGLDTLLDGFTHITESQAGAVVLKGFGHAVGDALVVGHAENGDFLIF